MEEKHGKCSLNTVEVQVARITSSLLHMWHSVKQGMMESKRNFTFENYFTIHQKAHLDLETYEEAVPETRKTHDFVNGIYDPKAAAVKVMANAMPHLLADFTAMANYIASALDIQLTLTSTERNISDMTCNTGHGSHVSFLGGQGHEQGRGGKGNFHGGGQGCGRNPAYTSSWKEWQYLSLKEQEKVIAARTARTKVQLASPNGRWMH